MNFPRAPAWKHSQKNSLLHLRPQTAVILVGLKRGDPPSFRSVFLIQRQEFWERDELWWVFDYYCKILLKDYGDGVNYFIRNNDKLDPTKRYTFLLKSKNFSKTLDKFCHFYVFMFNQYSKFLNIIHLYSLLNRKII